jgi:hypothetical protein
MGTGLLFYPQTKEPKMTKLYIANCTKMIQDFLFKLPGQTAINSYRAQIQIGGQQLIMNRDIPRETAEFIVDQHRKYGIVAVEDIDRTRGFFGLCFQLDREIDVERIMMAVIHNEEATEIRGHENRKLQAAALSNNIDNNLQGSDSKLQGLEVDIIEQPKPGSHGQDQMKETIQIAKPGSKAEARGAQKAQQSR